MTNGISSKYSFIKAVPVWAEGREKEMNVSLCLRSIVHGNEEIKINIAAHSRYQIFINGTFFASGPARACHGYYRVSEYAVSDRLSEKENVITILTIGYNSNSYYLLDEPSFVCAEIIKNNEVIFATGDEKCEAYMFNEREQKTPRYSFQRPFTECYSLKRDYDYIRTDSRAVCKKISLCKTQSKSFIERNVPYCLYSEKAAEKALSKGTLTKKLLPEKFTDRSLKKVSDKLRGYEEKELTSIPANEAYAYKIKITQKNLPDTKNIGLSKNGFCIYDMGKNNTGYIHLTLKAENDCTVYAVFNEILPDSVKPDPGKDGCQNVVKWTLEGGREYDLVTAEPYTFRYIQINALKNPVTVKNVSLLEECYPETMIINKVKMPTEKLQKVYDAAVETFRQNATDIFMDCPSRERAGWLCDSYFTARVEKELTGQSLVEHNFLENFIIPEAFGFIPEGMLPMCYPADHNDGVFIHNWAFWFVLEISEYLERTGDRAFIDSARDRIYKLLDFTKKYENDDGLIEKIDGWIFVEWSEANDFVKDINYPSNMLYALVLDTVAKLYDDKALEQKASALRRAVIEKSYDGEFFCDNAVYDKTGKAVRTDNRSETCQYYAFFTKTATKETFPELHEKMFSQFGPERKSSNNFPHIPFANAFIGNYLRLFILFNEGEYEKLVKEIESFFLPMAEKTGTLWENMTDSASCCHGFASHIAYWLNKIYK